MEEKCYVVIAIKYLLNLNNFQTEKQFEILGMFENNDEIDGFIFGYNGVMEKLKDTINDDGKMLISFSIETKEFDRKLSFQEVETWVYDNCSYEWEKNWKVESLMVKK